MASVFDGARFNELLFFPRPDATPPPPGAEELFVDVPDGRIHVRLHPAEGTRLTILHFHGNGEVVSDYDDLAPRFAALGARLVACDYRGYGRSQGTSDLRSCVADGPRVAAAVRAKVTGPLVIMGRSLGTMPVAPIYAAPPEGAIGCIWDSGVAELEGLLDRRNMTVDHFSDEDCATFDPLEKLATGSLPILVVHGEADDVISPREAQAAYDAAATERKHLVLVPGRGHNDLMGAPMYWDAVKTFLDEIS
jgi:alpha-beta hydrolase superfamily lysophospholipase